MKVAIWDLNHTLEKGSERALAEAINSTLEEMDFKRRVGEEEVLRLYGEELSEFVKEFFPSDINIPETVRKIDRRATEYLSKYVKAREGAVEVLRVIKKKRDFNHVISFVSSEQLASCLKLINLEPYVTYRASISDGKWCSERRRLISKSLDNLSKSEKLRYLSMPFWDRYFYFRTPVEFKTYFICEFARSTYVDMAVMIGDSPNDMKAVSKANEQFKHENTLLKQYGIVCRERKVIGVLFDPSGTRGDTKADYKIKDIREVLNILYS